MTDFSAVRRFGRRPLAGLLLLIIGFLSALTPAQAQDTGALDRDCPPAPDAIAPELPASLCIVLDARKSVDSLAGPLTFRWQMGDGQTREGVEFEYCYATRGHYIIQLDVLDPTTGQVRQHEIERVVDFTIPQGTGSDPMLRFTAPARAKVGETVEFKLLGVDLPLCLPNTVRYNWNFRDGLLGQGRTVTHAFRRAGTFVVRLAIDGSLEAGCLSRACVTRAIVIEP